jgi:predicted secreted protein
MVKCLMFMIFMMVSTLSFGSEHQMIDTLGVSPKGQYVALEEYGYKSQNHSYYVKISVMNVWTKEFVGNAIHVELPALRPEYLSKARAEAKLKSHDVLKHFQIVF